MAGAPVKMDYTPVMSGLYPLMSHFLPALSLNLEKDTRQYCHDQRNIGKSQRSNNSRRNDCRDV